MNVAGRVLLALLAIGWLPLAVASDSSTALDEECIPEPIFEGKVCTVQANRAANVGVILIHGLNGSVDDWRHTLPALAKNFHVVAFDLPGFGKSDKGSQLYSPTSYARLAQFLADRYFSSKPYHIIGHSMGGAIALRYAALRPLRFQRLVLLDAAGILHPLVISKFQAGSLVERASGVKQTRGMAERVSGKLLELADKLPILPTDIVNTSLGRDVVLSGGPAKIAALALSSEDFSFAVASVTEPTLILWGDNDLTVPLRTGQVLAARLAQARLEIIAGAGHEPMNDQSEQVNALINAHLLADAATLAKQLQKVAPATALRSERVASCNGESDKLFSGDYRSLELRDCTNVAIHNARIGKLTVINSRVTLLDTAIIGAEEGLVAENSNITITNGEISGVIAVNAVSSRLDLAGVQLKGSQDAVKAVASKLVCSLCEVKSPHRVGALHDYKSIDNDVL
ncbi:MAG TPA: alpha/beta hydrolase [Gammaproteobacteria bacterium]